MTVLRDRLLWRAAVALAVCCMALFAQAPSYSAASIVNAASNQTGPLAPNELVTIYGENLAVGTAALSAADIGSGVQLPYTLPAVNTMVLVDNYWGHVIYASPGQVNFLVPSNIRPGVYALRVVRNGVGGPSVTVEVAASAPGLFQANAHTVLATHADGSLVTTLAPASPGEVIVLYATGLGVTDPPQQPGYIAKIATVVADPAAVPVYLSGTALPASSVYYTGLTPGFAGLYQINLRLPATLTDDPEIRVGVTGQQSPAGLTLPLKKS